MKLVPVVSVTDRNEKPAVGVQCIEGRHGPACWLHGCACDCHGNIRSRLLEERKERREWPWARRKARAS